MHPDICVQIIETTGVVLSPLLALVVTFLLIRRIYRFREQFDHEKDLLKEALFYRHVIQQYEEDCCDLRDDGRTMRQQFWDKAKADLSMDSPRRTTPAIIKSRLSELDSLTENVEKVIDNISL